MKLLLNKIRNMFIPEENYITHLDRLISIWLEKKEELEDNKITIREYDEWWRNFKEQEAIL